MASFSFQHIDFGMARDVQQENIYERKTKVIKKLGRERGCYSVT